MVDESLPGAVLQLIGQDVVIRDSTFASLASGADGTLIALNSSLIIVNTTFTSNIQAAAGALFLNGSRATVFDSLFDRNKGGLLRASCGTPLGCQHSCCAPVGARLSLIKCQQLREEQEHRVSADVLWVTLPGQASKRAGSKQWAAAAFWST